MEFRIDAVSSVGFRTRSCGWKLTKVDTDQGEKVVSVNASIRENEFILELTPGNPLADPNSRRLHIRISIMHEAKPNDRLISSALDHADIDKLIQQLQAAKALLVPDDSGQVDLLPGHKYRRLIGSEWTACDENGVMVSNGSDKYETVSNISDTLFAEKKRLELFETTPPIEPDAVCRSCGFRFDHHSYAGFCIDRLPDNMRRFSTTRKFTP